MGVIKDILDAKSIEQKRKLVHKVVADKEDKDRLMKCNSEGSDGDDVFDIRYVDLRGISDKNARMMISSHSNYQVYWNSLKSKVMTECMTANTLYPLKTDDLAFHATYTMACMLDVRMNTENNISLRDAILDYFNVDIETLPTLTKEEFLNLGADDYSNWIYNSSNQPFYD